MTRPRVLVLAKRSAISQYFGEETARDLIAMGIAPPHSVLGSEGTTIVHHRRQQTPDARISQLLSAEDPTVMRLVSAHEQHEATVAEVQDALVDLGCETELVTASRLAVFRVIVERMTKESRPPTLVVTVGGDGTLLAASHAIGETPILAVNSAPDFSVGFFAGARSGTVRDTLAAALDGSLPRTQLTRMAVERDGEVLTTRVLNEVLLCANSPAATSRYILQFNEREEDQKSSGIWIGPASGSTAAMRGAGGRVMPLTSKRLQFVVREPYAPEGHLPVLLRGIVRRVDRLEIHSKMWEGRIFVDGQFQVYPITYGEVLRFRPSSEPLTILGSLERPTWMKNAKKTAVRK